MTEFVIFLHIYFIMYHFTRDLKKAILERISPGKVIIIRGARRVGKTDLLQSIRAELTQPCMLINGEDASVQEQLMRRTAANYSQLLGSIKFLMIDEAQYIQGIGGILKLMIDQIEGLCIIVSGSSSFSLSNETGEPITGRKWEYTLYPLSENEYLQAENAFEHTDKLNTRLVYGSYPELYHIPDLQQKREYLMEIRNSYLLKDILQFENIRNSNKIFNLLRLIAYQLGSQVSYNELGKQLSLSKNTVEKYLDLLSKCFILYKLEGFSKNQRKEVSKSPKWYYYDNGIRNAVISHFEDTSLRNDMGQLWENFMIAERIKQLEYNRSYANLYFWRTYDGQEIDLVEERNGRISAFEMKWSAGKVKVPAAWQKSYPEAPYRVIHPRNATEWFAEK